MHSQETINQTASVFQNHRDELGFVSTAQCKEKDLYVEKQNNRVVGAAICNHCVRKPQTTLYDIAVTDEYKNRGIGTKIVKKIKRDSPHNKIVAKCPENLSANKFYEKTGWEKINKEDGKNVDLNVYEYTFKNIDIITTGRPDLTTYAHSHGWLSGCRLDALKNYERDNISPAFIDVHWENPDRNELLKACKKHEPKYVVAGDYDGSNFEVINSFADDLNEHAENVIIVPHGEGEVRKVPDKYVVGYSTPSGYAETDAPIEEYQGNDIHILGGTMNKLDSVTTKLYNDIISIDTNTHHRDATQFGEYWSQTVPQRKKIPTTETCVREAYENAVVNMTYGFEQWGLITKK